MGEVHQLPGYTVAPATYALRPGWDVAAALWTPEAPTGGAVIVPHGHFGQGKSSPEAQEIAHRLAALGAVVLAVDTPGVEEWDRPERQIHMADGAHNRAFLAAGGTSALALQLAILRRGLDVLASQGGERFAATGASGGAVQSFYLPFVDERIEGVALASYPPMPREARAGGCACDQVPGWPGPDPAVVAALPRPSLWLSDGPSDPPPGLPASGRHEATTGPHSYTREMQDHAVPFLAELVGLRSGALLDPVPLLDLSTGTQDPDAPGIFDLPLTPTELWTPTASGTPPAYELSCAGTGPGVLVLGGEQPDQDAIVAAGLRACMATIKADPTGTAEGIARQRPYAETLATGVTHIMATKQLDAIYAVRGWALPAAGSGHPFVAREPLTRIDQLDVNGDPTWVHVPGMWWGAGAAAADRALSQGTEPQSLSAALHQAIKEKKRPASKKR